MSHMYLLRWAICTAATLLDLENGTWLSTPPITCFFRTAVPIIRANSQEAQVGIVVNLWPKMPASQSKVDLAKARIEDGEINRWYLDALSGRGYPSDIVASLGDSFDVVFPGDMDEIVDVKSN